MTTTQRERIPTLASALGLVTTAMVLPAQAQATCDAATAPHCPVVKHFDGRDGNWFNPANWTDGTLPTATDDVVLDGDDKVLIDPVQGQSRVQVGRLLLKDRAHLETRPGTILRSRVEHIADQARIQYRGSASAGGRLVVTSDSGAFGCTDCTNPTTKDKRDIVINTKGTVQMGLGGREPASIRRGRSGHPELHAGPGHYATMRADTIRIRGELRLSLHYGFEPQSGDVFQLLTARETLSGQFDGLPQGGYVGCTANNLGLRINYRAGDGNDVAVRAEELHPGVCRLLPTISTVGQALDNLAAVVDDAVAQTREHVLLAGPWPTPPPQPPSTGVTREHVLRSGPLSPAPPPPPPPSTGQTREHIFLSH